MDRHSTLRIMLLTFFFSVELFTQPSAIYQSLIYSRSLHAAGMGEQGVASRNTLDAMQYNPALLVHSNRFNFSYFNNPWNILGWHTPLTAINSSWKLENGAAIGLDYTYWNFGDLRYSTADNPLGNEKTYHFYERSISAGYAMPLDERIAFGLQARYAWLPTPDNKYIQHLLFSAGILAKPEIFSNRMTIGLSLMNFSTAVEMESIVIDNSGNTTSKAVYDSPPSQLNLGIQEAIITNEFFDVDLFLGMMKPIVARDAVPDYNGRSSFYALINSWDHFPNDATGQVGMSAVWHPINLGGGVSFFQEINLGYFNIGPKSGLISFMTHGAIIGIQYNGLKMSAGYAGRWHNFHNNSFLRWDFPWETVQFSLSSDTDFWGKWQEESFVEAKPDKIIISSGYTFGESVGKMKKSSFSGVDVSFKMINIFSFESDFYISDNSALHMAFRYSKAVQAFDINLATLESPLPLFIPPHIDLEMETMSLESGYRYHPLDEFQPLFFQGSIGIIRMNPVIPTAPKYNYQTYDEIALGLVLPIMESGVIVIPRAGWKTIFMKEFGNSNNLGGYNQFTLGINAGYTL